MRISFDDKCKCCNSPNTYREHDRTGDKWDLGCRSCGHSEVFIDMNEFHNPQTALGMRINDIPHSDERRDSIVKKWFN